MKIIKTIEDGCRNW